MTNGNIFTELLYNPSKSNPRYRYYGGFNLQAVIAYVVGIALPFPGFVQSLGATGVNAGGQRLFDLGWLLSFAVSFVLYYAICLIWPTKNQRMIREEGLGWEQKAKMQTLAGSRPWSPEDRFDEKDGQVVESKKGDLDVSNVAF